MNCPVVCDDFSEIVNKHVSAISCGVVIRFSNGIFFMIDLSFLSPFLIDFIQVSYEGVQLSAIIMAFVNAITITAAIHERIHKNCFSNNCTGNQLRFESEKITTNSISCKKSY